MQQQSTFKPGVVESEIFEFQAGEIETSAEGRSAMRQPTTKHLHRHNRSLPRALPRKGRALAASQARKHDKDPFETHHSVLFWSDRC